MFSDSLLFVFNVIIDFISVGLVLEKHCFFVFRVLNFMQALR